MTESRKERERQLRRELLLEAAAQVFGRKPFDEATMQEVALEAQIGMQGLYEHFPSKQELYESVIVLRGETFRARADAALQGVAEPLEQIRALATVYAQQFKDHPVFLPMFIRDRVHYDWGFDSRFGERIQQIYEAERHRLRVIVEHLVAGGIFRPLETDFLIQVCLNLLEASLYHSHRNHSGEEVSVCVDRAMACLLQGVGGRP